jgi:hypothetical protein
VSNNFRGTEANVKRVRTDRRRVKGEAVRCMRLEKA